MTVSINMKTPVFYLRVLTCILGIAGLVTMVISSTMSNTNTLFTLPMLSALAVLALVLVAVSLLISKHDYLSAASVLAAIALFTVVIGNIISNRILMIAGLFSYNSGNTVGWSVFYVTVASIACYLVTIFLLIISSFMKSNK